MILILLPFLLFSFQVTAAPTLDVKLNDGQKNQVNLSEFKGKVVYVDFWASWCGPCRKSFPWMAKMHHKYADKGLAIVAINLDTDDKDANRFLSEMPVNFTIRYDPNGDVAALYNLQGMPSSFLFNKKGQLVQQHVGFFSSKLLDYEQELIELLKE